MVNWKHTTAAVCAVVTVVSMAVVQYSSSMSAMADEKDVAQLAILTGDGEGETPAFADYSEIAPLTETVFEEKTGYISYDGGSVNVRQEASKEAEIVGSLALGDAMQITDITDDGLWYAVTLADGVAGYVMCDLITFDYNTVRMQMLSTTMYQTATVSVSGGRLNVRNAPSENNSVVIDQVADGDIVYVSEYCENGWLKVLFGKDYDTGYVMSAYVTLGEMVHRTDVDTVRKDRLNSVAKKGTIVTASNYVNVRNAPSESADVVTTVKNGTKCTIISQGSKWTKILTADNRTAYIITSAIFDDVALANYNAKKSASVARAEKAQATVKAKTTVPENSAMGAKIIAEAEKYIGVKYVYGGTSPAGFDCSGLVQYTLKNVGISVNRSSRDQYKNGVAVDRSDLQAGDLVFFSKGGSITHVGIYAGNDKVIHSPSAGHTVCYTTLSHMCSYSTYVGARRVY
ncbi:MAG: NlpC/P60 family protein [Clostridia bacterium]|nr:NlpC/P60 family protein [Clostridia bacterium]